VTDQSQRHPSRLVYASVLFVLLNALGAAAWLSRAALGHTLAHWTGETELRCQLRGAASLLWQKATQRTPRTDPLVPIAHTGVSPYGVNTFLQLEVEPAKVERSLRLASEAGFRFIRQQFPWEDIEVAGKGDYVDPKWGVNTWEKYDRIVALAEQYDIEIIARLDAPPAWSRSKGSEPGWTKAPPDNLADYGDYVAAVVSRYRGRIGYYQIWNEPNIFDEWGDQPADPAGYVQLLKTAYTRAKQADPECRIIAAGLAATTQELPPEFGPRNVSDLRYLEQMYAAGARGYFDIMGVMSYGLWTGPYDLRLGRDRTNYSRAQLVREIMVRNGDAAVPLWASEVGWNALPEDYPGVAAYGRVTEEQQARYAVEAYERASDAWPWMGVLNYWFLRRPSDAERDQAWYYFRLLEPDFVALPAYAALAAQANQPPALDAGYHQEDDWALHYEGDWQHLADPEAVLGAYALGQDDAQLSFYMEGTALALTLRDPRQLDHLTVTIDGAAVRPPRAWNTPTSGQPAVVVARSLSNARHEVQVRVHGGPVHLDGLVVWRRSVPWALWACGMLGALLVIAGRALRRHTAESADAA
jgi:hypothetical protein